MKEYRLEHAPLVYYISGKVHKVTVAHAYEHDIPAELTAVELWHKNESDSKLIIFENVGHCVNMDAPQQFNTVLEHFWTDS